MARAVTFITVLLGLWITGCAVRPSREEVRQLLETEVTPRDARPIAEASVSRNLEPALREAAPVEAGAAFLEDESADYPLCEGLPRNGIRVIDTAHVISTNCTWHGHPGLQVTLKETLTFQGTLVLKGEIQIMGEQELDGPCINVSGKMTVIAANASFVGCRNRMKDGKGGALFIQRDLIVSNSSVKFENCRASAGGGLYTGSFLQEAESTVTFENCGSGFGNAGGGAHVRNDFTQGPKSSAIFRSCSANGFGGGLYTGSFSQEAESMVTFENCTGASSLSGGGASVKENFTQGRKSSAIFRNGGGLYTDGSFFQEAESTVTFENCTGSFGGGAHVKKNFTQGRNSSAIFRSCSAAGYSGDGGGLYTDGSFFQEAESMVTFEDCTASSSGGGGARVKENFRQGRKSSAIFRRCSAQYSGGGLSTGGSFLQEAESTVTFENCTGFSGRGGGAYVSETFTQGHKSSAIFRSSRARFGGGLYAGGSFSQAEESAVTFENCTGFYGGGAWVMTTFTQGPKSSAIFRSCSARGDGDGGGLYTDGSFSQEAESMVTFENCTCSNDGGGARVWKVFTQAPKSSAIFRSCRARSGGGLYTDGSFSQEAESMVTFENCTCSGDGGGARVWKVFTQARKSSAIFRSCRARSGGGIHAPGSYEQQAGSSVLFEHCSADRDGGGVATKDLSGNGSMHFKSCRARTGGGLSITTGRAVRHDGSLAFEECNASILGGGLYIDAGQGQFRKLLFDRCDADVSAAALAAIAANGTEAELRLEELSLLRGSEGNVNDIAVPGLLKLGSVHLSTASSSGIYISAHNLSLEDVMNCTNTSACTFRANAARWAGFLCPLGTGSVDFEGLRDFGCLACKPGDTQVLNVTSRPCSQCPEGASKCLASELKMEPGLMVELEDVKRSFHCPNEAACPGGDVSQGRVHLAMCAAGYRGQGCTSCSDEHAMADSSVFSCTACSKDRRVQAVQWITFLSQRTFLFAIGALSAFGAKKAGDLKRSSIYLNQLMAFATISNTILAAVLQTQTAKNIKSDAANFFFNAAMHTAEAASGQGSLRSASSQCLLSYLGYEKTLWGSHLLDVVVAAGLISSLSLMKDSRVALIAGMNCFLPTIAADFGKYLVCYRLRRDDAAGLQGLHCPFLPGSAGLASATQVVAGFILFMVAALWTWLSLSRSDEDPKPSHVVFLTSKYQRRYALFETERLIRKTLFTFIGALLPIDSSPALQMGCLGIVVSVSLFLYCRYKPYHSPEWNWIEICLLFAATVMITSVSTLLANEFHWGHSVPTQQSIIFATAGIAAAASAIMVFRVIQELVREQRQAAK